MRSHDSFWVGGKDVETLPRLYERLPSPQHHLVYHRNINTEKSTERRIKVGNNVTHERDRENRDDTHGEVQPVGFRLDKENPEEREEAKTLQECPSKIIKII